MKDSNISTDNYFIVTLTFTRFLNKQMPSNNCTQFVLHCHNRHSNLLHKTYQVLNKQSKHTLTTKINLKHNPNFPRYKHKSTGRQVLDFNYQMFNIHNNQININSLGIHLPIPSYLDGLQSKKHQTTIDINQDDTQLELTNIRIAPYDNEYTIELIYVKADYWYKPRHLRPSSYDAADKNSTFRYLPMSPYTW